MNTLQKILKILLENRGRFVSGTEIGRRLGISRSAVSRNITTLRERDLAVESNPGQGHRLIELPEGLHPDILQLKINGITSDLELKYREQVESTNTLLKQIASRQAEAGCSTGQDILLLAEEQTAGRGRRNRSWDSPPGQGLYFSLLLHPDISPDRAPLLTGLTSLALERSLYRHGFPVQLKWPNDLLLAGRKVAGILAEVSTDMDQVSHVIIGVGLNTTRTSFPRELENQATSLKKYLQQQPENYDTTEQAREKSQGTSQRASRENSKKQPDDITEESSESTPEEVLEEISGEISEEISNETTEKTSIKRPIESSIKKPLEKFIEKPIEKLTEKPLESTGEASQKTPLEIPEEEILLDFLREFYQLLDLFTTDREAEVIADWKASLQIIGEKIAISTGNREIRGKVRDISPRGEIVLQTEKGEEQRFWAGDVTVIN